MEARETGVELVLETDGDGLGAHAGNKMETINANNTIRRIMNCLAGFCKDHTNTELEERFQFCHHPFTTYKER